MNHFTDVSKSVLKLVRNNDRLTRAKLLLALQRWLCPEYFLPDPNVDWYGDPVFTEYLGRFRKELIRFNPPRRWNLYQLLRLSLPIEGDTVECGSHRGAGSWLICQSTRGLAKQHHIFDSFEGLSDPGTGDGAHWSTGDLAVSLDEVKQHLSAFPSVSYYKGWIPDRFKEVEERRFSFVHIDVDLEQPTHDSLAFFYPRTNPGGVIVCDDYGSSVCPGATRTVDAYLADKPDKMLSLSPGGGFLIRGREAPACPLT
jgi:hypothetical protein